MTISDILNFFKVANDLRGAAYNFTVSNPIICLLPDYMKEVVHVRFDLVVENHANRPATIPSIMVSFQGGPWYASLPRNPIANNVGFHALLAKDAPSGPLSESASEIPATIPPLEMRRILFWLTVPCLSELPGQLLGAVHTLQSCTTQAHIVSTTNTACIHDSTSCSSISESTAAHQAEDNPSSPVDKVLQLQFLVRGRPVHASVVLQLESY